MIGTGIRRRNPMGGSTSTTETTARTTGTAGDSAVAADAADAAAVAEGVGVGDVIAATGVAGPVAGVAVATAAAADATHTEVPAITAVRHSIDLINRLVGGLGGGGVPAAGSGVQTTTIQNDHTADHIREEQKAAEAEQRAGDAEDEAEARAQDNAATQQGESDVMAEAIRAQEQSNAEYAAAAAAEAEAEATRAATAEAEAEATREAAAEAEAEAEADARAAENNENNSNNENTGVAVEAPDDSRAVTVFVGQNNTRRENLVQQISGTNYMPTSAGFHFDQLSAPTLRRSKRVRLRYL